MQSLRQVKARPAMRIFNKMTAEPSLVPTVRLAAEKKILPKPSGAAESTPVVLLHPLLSNAKSWNRFMRRLEKHPERKREWDITSLNLRNHGDSPSYPVHNYLGMVADLHRHLAEHNMMDKPLNLVGHSMGGKLAMMFALMFPSAVDSLTIVDAAPCAYQSSHSHSHLFKAMLNVPLHTIKGRVEVTHALEDQGLDANDVGYALKNLRAVGVKFAWDASVDTLLSQEANVHDWSINDIFNNPYIHHYAMMQAKQGKHADRHEQTDPSAALTFAGPALFYGGSTSGRLSNTKYLESIAPVFPNSKIVLREGGHFVHNEHPADFCDHLVRVIDGSS